MIKLPIGAKFYSSNGNEVTVIKNGTKYITVQHGHYEYKCTWSENKLKYNDNYNNHYYRSEIEHAKFVKLQEVQKQLYQVNQDFGTFYKIETKSNELKTALLAIVSLLE